MAKANAWMLTHLRFCGAKARMRFSSRMAVIRRSAVDETTASKYGASPVYADGKIYLTARDGTVTVVKLGPKFEVLAVNKLPDQLAASPVIAGGRIYLRGFEALYAIGTERR